MCSCVYFSFVINLSCTTLLKKQLNVCPVCSDSRDGSTKLTTRRSAHDRLTWHSGAEQTVEDVFIRLYGLRTAPLADLGFFRGGDWEPERAKRASIDGVWAYGRMKFERLSPGFGSRRGTKRHRNNLSHA